MKQQICILGSTGSIGTQTLEVARKLGLNVTSLSAYGSIGILEEQIREFRPSLAVVYDANRAEELKIKIADTDTKVLSGMEAVDRIAETKTDIYNDRPVKKQVMKKVTIDTFGEDYPEPEKL